MDSNLHSKSHSSAGEDNPDESAAPYAAHGRHGQLSATEEEPDEHWHSDEPIDGSDVGSGLTGQTIDHYEFGERLGGGAMAAVYHANDLDSRRQVALKVLLPGADSVTRERFRREARVLTTLVHPHIIPTYHVGQTDASGTIYIAMELVTGQSLADLLSQEAAMSARDACALLAPIAHALDYAHRNGVVHRDVKPSNILLRQESSQDMHAVYLAQSDGPVVPLLSDFGIALALDAPELTSAGRTIGTPAFMSPEQCAGNDEIDGRADIYSLGAVLYRCIVGRTPYKGSTTQILHAHVYDPLLIPQPVMFQVPTLVLQIIQRSMAKEPAARYQRASEMAADLELVLDTLSRDDVHEAELTDATLTLESIPVTAPQESKHVLVPAPDHTPQFGVIPARRIPAQIPIKEPSRPAKAPRQQRQANSASTDRAGVVILGVALLLLVGLLSLMLVNSILPLDPGDNPAVTQLADASQSDSSGNPGSSVPDETDSPIPPAQQGGAGATSATATVVATYESNAPSTPTVRPTLVVVPEWAWSQATAFHSERAWEETREWTIAVRNSDPEYEKAAVDEMLIDALVGLATVDNANGNYSQAEEHLASALAVVTSTASITSEYGELQQLHMATADMVSVDVDNNLDERKALQRAHTSYAIMLEERGVPCMALEHLDAALIILPDVNVDGRRREMSAACTGENQAEELRTLDGAILYSSEVNGDKGIYWMSVEEAAGSILIVDNAAQPSLRPDGGYLSFHSIRQDYQGLAGFDITANLNPNERSIRYTDHVEDSRESPPSWSPQGDQLAFASTNESDGKSRVYWVRADSSRDVHFLAMGRDPAWHPFHDRIVFNGFGESGDREGLWLIQSDGSNAVQLTDNGNDIRPTWSHDGRYVVFMSARDGGNSDLYRIDVTAPDTGPVRLTERAAQDGIPAVSPDDRHIAFLSDEDGIWRLWIIRLEGGEPQLLGPITGSLISWLEHGIQWID